MEHASNKSNGLTLENTHLQAFLDVLSIIQYSFFCISKVHLFQRKFGSQHRMTYMLKFNT